MEKHGKGFFIDGFGNFYEGNWKSDIKFGKGRLIPGKDNFHIEGEWNDKVIKGKKIINGFPVYDGEFYFGTKMHGKGELIRREYYF